MKRRSRPTRVLKIAVWWIALVAVALLGARATAQACETCADPDASSAENDDPSAGVENDEVPRDRFAAAEQEVLAERLTIDAHDVGAGDPMVSPSLERERLIETRRSLLNERQTTRPGGRILRGGLTGLLGLGAAVGVIAAHEPLTFHSTRDDGTVKDHVGLFATLLICAGAIAAAGLGVFLSGIQHRRLRQQIDERVDEIEEDLVEAEVPREAW